MEPLTGRNESPDPSEAELAPAPERSQRARLVEVYALLAVLGFAALAFLAYTFGHFEQDVTLSMVVQSFHPAWFDMLMRAVSAFGYNPQAWIAVAGPAGLLYLLKLRWESLITGLAGTVSALLGTLAKLVIGRPRPSDDLVEVLRDLPGFGFPSGHVVFYTGFFGFLWFLAYTLLPAGPLRSVLLVLLGGLVALVGLSRVYLGVHWASDAIGGYLLGSLALLAFVAIYRRGNA
jgi:undecaprenyl-diphosphatase